MSRSKSTFDGLPKLTKDGKLQKSIENRNPHEEMPFAYFAALLIFCAVSIDWVVKHPPSASEFLPLERFVQRQHWILADFDTEYSMNVEKTAFDVAVVLGYRLNERTKAVDDRCSYRLKSRVEHAIERFCYRKVENVMFSGASPSPRKKKKNEEDVVISEAEAMFKYAVEIIAKAPKVRGRHEETYRCPIERETFVPLERGDGFRSYVGRDSKNVSFKWVLEENSYSTRDNAEKSLLLAKEHGWKSIVVSTSHFHQFRAKRVFKKVISNEKELKRANIELKMLKQTREAELMRYLPKDGSERTTEFFIAEFEFFRELLAIAYYKLIRNWI